MINTNIFSYLDIKIKTIIRLIFKFVSFFLVVIFLTFRVCFALYYGLNPSTFIEVIICDRILKREVELKICKRHCTFPPN